MCVGDTGSISMIRHRKHTHTHWIFSTSAQLSRHTVYCINIMGESKNIASLFRKRRKEIWIHLNTFMCLKSNVSKPVHKTSPKSKLVIKSIYFCNMLFVICS